MNKLTLIACLASTTFFMSCSNDDDNSTNVNAPETYTFTREGATSVNYGGQTTRIQMGEEFIVALKDNTKTEAALDAMFAHEAGNNDFSNASRNSAASTEQFPPSQGCEACQQREKQTDSRCC